MTTSFLAIQKQPISCSVKSIITVFLMVFNVITTHTVPSSVDVLPAGRLSLTLSLRLTRYCGKHRVDCFERYVKISLETVSNPC